MLPARSPISPVSRKPGCRATITSNVGNARPARPPNLSTLLRRPSRYPGSTRIQATTPRQVARLPVASAGNDRQGAEGTVGEYIDKGAIKVIEIIGVSDESFEDAVNQAVAKASETIKGITGVEVVQQSAKVADGKISQYRADVKLAFAVK
ncbi:MAG: dodecin family protein [Acidimicrobiia bacterium]|nr:dodecin family protein [Acidimicrobiia bacterium]NNC75436.1 dodecin domain-containing protein [Acidimicrobiia bacterium]